MTRLSTIVTAALLGVAIHALPAASQTTCTGENCPAAPAGDAGASAPASDAGAAAPAAQPSADTAQQPAAGTAQQPAAEAAQQPATEAAQQPATDTAQQPAADAAQTQQGDTATTGAEQPKDGTAAAEQPKDGTATAEQPKAADAPKEETAEAAPEGKKEVTTEERTVIRERIREYEGPRVSVNFNVNVGTAIPTTYELRPAPTYIVEYLPAYRGYLILVTEDGQILVISPKTRKIVYVL